MLWTILYIAFGIVALWLLGEVLLQYKARLRWRVLAFAGFVTVVIGVVALSSVLVITLGAMAFAVGQTFVTLSYRRGFSTGWALGGMPGSSRRRRGAQPAAADEPPVLEVTQVVADASQPYDAGTGAPELPEGQDSWEPPAYAPEPLPDETGEYGVYDRGDQLFSDGPEDRPAPTFPGGYGHGPEDQHQYAAWADPHPAGQDTGQDPAHAGQYATAGYQPYDGYAGSVSFDPQGGIPAPPGHAPVGYGADGYPAGDYSSGDHFSGSSADGYGTGYGTDGYAAGYGTDGQGTGYTGQSPYQPYDAYGSSYGSYGPHDSYAPYAPQDPGTPPGGVWVPQQREQHREPGGLPAEEPYPYPDGHQPPGHQPYGYDATGYSYDPTGYSYDEQRGY
ncbi:hypothetical protein [Streptomyces sp. JJ36]|uniref:hypothetical protein n=1 Tax=Streptomyces sp. JJ36 TaxID=2736645 RepID=UPI001F387AE3|nr:hypothetical protein [Streptomyces sp. JJ36]MCF6523010.1 hypothetical protein [Streptomyces sp. JJ36]